MGKRHVPKYLRHKAKKKRRVDAASVALTVCLVLLVVTIGAVVGKYLHQYYSESSVGAMKFYFTSDLLDGGIHTLAPGSQEVEFKLSNHADDLRYSEVDITYEVTIKPADDGTPADGGTVVYGDGETKLVHGGIDDNKVTLTNLKPGTYTVEARTIGGYQKTLTATLVVQGPESSVYKYLEAYGSEYVLLTVWAQGYKGTVTITPPTGLIPDNTDAAMKNAKTGEVITVDSSLQGNGYWSHTYRFFCGTETPVTAESFAVTYGSQTATVKAPN